MAKRRPAKREPSRKPHILRDTAPLATRNPCLEAIAVTVHALPSEDASRTVARLARRVGLSNWSVQVVVANRGEFELVPPHHGRIPTPGAAWDITYRLRDQPETVHAEPLFTYKVADLYRRPVRRGSADEIDHPATADRFEWSLEKANVIGAWSLFGSRPPGAGVTIGHPDTGFTPHPELADTRRVLIDQGYDFDDDDANPIDDLDDGFQDNPGHGTGTGSVIVSNRGAAVGNQGREFVSGVAPFASLIPIRTTESVVLFSMRGLRRAIDHAVSKGAQVISISLGGPLPSAALRNAVRRAGEAGTIVLAAAGNRVGFVVFPAAFDETIAVAASTITDQPWPGSSRGDAVDITAPGASVWRARVERSGEEDFRFSVTRGSGTSFAVATTAGVAALWLSLHGPAALERRYGAADVSRVFKAMLQQTCRRPRGWDTDNFGPGIVDAKALLEAPLLQQVPARKLRDPRRAAVATDPIGLEAIVHLLPDAPRSGVEQTVAEMLHVADRDLPKAIQDVGDELVFQLVMEPQLRARLEVRARRLVIRGRRLRVARVPSPELDRRTTSRRLAARLRGTRR
jgi:serine protease